mgnify:FL=1
MVIKMRHDKKEKIDIVLKYLPSIFTSLAEKDTDSLCEIRLRVDRPVALVFSGRTDYITKSGRLTGFYSSDLFSFSRTEIEEIFIRLCGYSVHSLTDNIADGFITLDGGIRIGVYGTAVVRDGKITSVRNVEGLNIRIPAEYKGCALPIYNRLFRGRMPNTVICGAPMSGKTTVLRDLCRLISDEEHKKITVIDERCEMSGYDLGINTDVLKNYPKAQGIGIAVRTLSPDVVICDEIGSVKEAEELCTLVNCGVKFIVTMHCSELYELKRRPQFNLLSEAGATEACVFLNEKDFTVKKILMNRS